MTPPADDERDPSRGRQFRLRSLMIAVAVAAVAMGALRVPGAGLLAFGVACFVVAILAIGLSVLLVTMALGFIGFELCSLLASLVRRPLPTPGPADERREDPTRSADHG